MGIAVGGIAPYGSPKSTLDVIIHHRENRFKGAIDRERLERAGIASSPPSAQRTIQTLRLLGLIDDDGNPTDTFTGLAEAPASEYQERLEEAIREVYEAIFEVVEPSDGYEKVRDAFRSNTPHAQQKRMVTLFLNLCGAAGMIDDVPKSSEKPETARQGGDSAPRKQRTPRRAGEAPDEPWAKFSTIAGIMQKLPVDSGEWTQKERDDWYDTLGTILDFDVTIIKPEEGSTQNNQNG